ESTTSSATGIMDLTADGAATPARGGGSIDARIGTLALGRSNGSTGAGTGRLTYDAGIVDANDVTLGENTGGTTALATGTLEVKGIAQLIVNNNITLGKSSTGTTAPIGNLTIS